MLQFDRIIRADCPSPSEEVARTSSKKEVQSISSSSVWFSSSTSLLSSLSRIMIFVDFRWVSTFRTFTLRNNWECRYLGFFYILRLQESVESAELPCRNFIISSTDSFASPTTAEPILWTKSETKISCTQIQGCLFFPCFCSKCLKNKTNLDLSDKEFWASLFQILKNDFLLGDSALWTLFWRCTLWLPDFDILIFESWKFTWNPYSERS